MNNIDATAPSHPPTFERLKRGKNLVMVRWEEASRSEVSAARDKDSHTVRDEIAQFIDALVENLRVMRTNATSNETVSATHHGQQRAGLIGYTLKQTIHEYGLLRSVLIDYLSQSGTISEEERRITHRSVDHAIELASNEFARAEQSKINLALAKAEASNRDLEQFALIAAHDLKSPIGSILGFAEIVRDEIGSGASSVALGCLNTITGLVKRMIALIDDVLSYAQLKSNRDEFKLVSMEEAVNAAIQNLKSSLTASSGRVGHMQLPKVPGSLPLLTQLFQNLIANAIRYRGDTPPEIDVSVRQRDGHWLFCVRDNGIGFDDKEKEVIFEVHKQLGAGRRTEGAGLGLATCRRVVEIHGGRIWAESSANRGATFYFTLPQTQ